MANTHNLLQAQRWLHEKYPAEEHNIGGDCINPKCDYEFTEQDVQGMSLVSGWFTCPDCQQTYNYLNTEVQDRGGYTRSGLTMTEMGQLGETVVQRMGTIPGVGPVAEISSAYHNPLDAVIGPYGVEIKTNHSESQPRFKIGGERTIDPQTGQRQPARQNKINYATSQGLIPALVGVRLNFYTDKADIFFRPEMKDTWIGAKALQHVATVDFSDINPFRNPQDVPPASELPDDDEDGIPF